MSKVVGVVVAALLVASCVGDDTIAVTVTPGSVPAGSSAEETAASETTIASAIPSTSAPSGAEGCADVIDVAVTGDGPFTFAVTVSSPDTGWDKYADEWRVESESGAVLAVRELTHPHVDEQPFTRSLGGVELEPGSTVIVAARDSVEGYCGERLTVSVGG